jgi:hypothetical protein
MNSQQKQQHKKANDVYYNPATQHSQRKGQIHIKKDNHDRIYVITYCTKHFVLIVLSLTTSKKTAI